MKIVIISDIHDNLVNLKKCLDYCNSKKVETLLCCGDVTNLDTLEFMSENFARKIFLVHGNMEIYEDKDLKKFKNINFLGRIGRIALAKKNIGLCHEPFLKTSVLNLGKCDYVFYGHTHKPWIENIGDYKFINPGTLGGVFQRATFALWDTNNAEPELVVLDMLET